MSALWFGQLQVTPVAELKPDVWHLSCAGQEEHGMPGLQPGGKEGQQQPIAFLAAAEENADMIMC